MIKLLIATHNQGKFKEIKDSFKDLTFDFKSLEDLRIKEEVKETGKTFKENAIIKAKFYGQKSGLLTLADDSGLKVAILGGRPGIRTSRYAPGKDKDRYQKLLNELKGIPWEKRDAEFIAVVAIFNPKIGRVSTFQGRCQGKIKFRPKGRKGFGYDPIFWHPGLKKTLAELNTREKNKIDHRGQALTEAKKFLKNRVC